MPVIWIGRPTGGRRSRSFRVADALVSLVAILAGAFWIMAAALLPREPSAAIWLIAPALAASAIVLHRIVVADASGFLGWAAAMLAGVGLALVVVSWLGQMVGLASDPAGFWGLGLIGPSYLLFGLGLARLGRPLGLAGVGILAGWCIPLVTLVVNLGAIVWIPLGAAWILFGLTNVWMLGHEIGPAR
jgi:hypothetical protein